MGQRKAVDSDRAIVFRFVPQSRREVFMNMRPRSENAAYFSKPPHRRAFGPQISLRTKTDLAHRFSRFICFSRFSEK